MGIVAGLDGNDPLGAFGRTKVGRRLHSQARKKLMTNDSNDERCRFEREHACGRMGARCAVRVTAKCIGRRRAIVAILIIAARTLMLMQVMTKMLACLACLMRTVRTGHAPSKLEC